MWVPYMEFLKKNQEVVNTASDRLAGCLEYGKFESLICSIPCLEDGKFKSLICSIDCPAIAY